jgi:N-acetylglucosaminyldiphosphoundecaprenol N-acetyl-beta-D-mannosaminyltransferase
MGARGVTRVYGPDLTGCVIQEAARKGVSVGFYGGDTRTVKLLAGALQRRFPSLRIAFTLSPPFRPLSEEEDARVTNEINESGARVLFVGLGAPKQERWMAAHRGRVQSVMLGVGAAFDFLAGTKSQAPRWIRSAGLEWLFRMLAEPRRLAPRYLRHNPRFVALFALQLLGLRVRW